MTKQGPTDPIVDELRSIKKLLILGLLKEGVASQMEIGATLGVDQSTVSKMFPKKIDFRSSSGRERRS